MSQQSRNTAPDCTYIANPCPAIELVIQPKTRDLGDFSVRRALPAAKQAMIGPWLFFDHFGPATFTPGQGINVRPHPHINIATVTYLFEGEILHRDSLGFEQAIIPGDINLMVAGSGITHSERERPEVNASEHSLHGLQLWMALPEEFEETPAKFIHYPGAHIPSAQVNGASVRVMMGSAFGLTSPVLTYAPTLYVEATLSAGQSLALPQEQQRAVYVVNGQVKIGDAMISCHEMAVISEADNVVIQAHSDCRIAIIGGDKMAPRHMFWNFASSRPERIEQAKNDWQQGKFAKVVGDEIEFIPLPDSQ